jgi:hypothetical protein
MKITLIALLLVAVSAAADPADPTSRIPSDPAERAPPAQPDTDSTWHPETKADDDADSDDDAWSTTRNGVNYETGQVCLTRGAGGLCLDAEDN